MRLVLNFSMFFGSITLSLIFTKYLQITGRKQNLKGKIKRKRVKIIERVQRKIKDEEVKRQNLNVGKRNLWSKANRRSWINAAVQR